MTLTHPAPSETRLSRGVFDDRRRLNRSYLLSLTDEGLLQNFLIEAGIGDQGWHLHPSEDSREARGLDRHWGWETPGSQLRGHFLGHWLSAAAREVAVTGDALLRARIDSVLDGLERCQEENGGGWIWAIPRGYLDRLATGRPIWAPQYAMHKLLMGLVDLHRDLGDERALRMAREATTPLLEWVRGFDDAQFQQILEVETGGMLEVWADLLEATGDPVYSELLERYYRRWLFDGLLEGRDVLTNKHANTTIPEVLGAARAYEVTGEERWRRIVEAYWEQAVTLRGTFCTGGQTSGEIWTPPFEFAARRGEKTQEHCGVYNMIRLADVLLRWTGDLAYADYIELNLYNGILAQQNPRTGMVAYFLPLEGGARKNWGSPTEDFWCCHGTLVQAHTRHSGLVFYRGGDTELVVAQHIDASTRVQTAAGEARVRVEVLDNAGYVGPDSNAGEAGDAHRPSASRVRIAVDGAALTVRVRVPEWTVGAPALAGSEAASLDDGALVIQHPGGATSVDVAFGSEVRAVPIPDEPATVAFVEGPVVLAGLVDREVSLRGDASTASALLAPDNERQWTQWLRGYRSTGQPTSIRFRPVHEIVDEPFSLYFPVSTGS
ncbi:glycoside hydrolase family 127 protein [Rathayibacter oskolensis]|uniref:beta-L-arabinofuranosidase domain-containing protein n=1 Tax=Rathayibacter oskolensis TaxID=1891671 RepID=UPI00265DB450|nr:beta-L-arabinofuranosidase domain-containing protein [Rathayibacter oskolensis]WKK70289.1 glycoside hydrolase family 127 protein [Rathayibacter oskolensis]